MLSVEICDFKKHSRICNSYFFKNYHGLPRLYNFDSFTRSWSIQALRTYAWADVPPIHVHGLRHYAELGISGTRSGRRLSLIHISEPTRLGMISYAVFCLKKKKTTDTCTIITKQTAA